MPGAGLGVGLVISGDIGVDGSTAASRLCSDGQTSPARIYALNDHASLTEAIDAYLAEEAPAVRPVQAVLAVASAITGDEVDAHQPPVDVFGRSVAPALRPSRGCA